MFYAETEPWIAAAAYPKYGHPEHDRDLLDALSPLRHVHRLTAPVLVIHGSNDTNVPVGESERLIDALGERGVPHRYLRLDGEGHDFLTRTAHEEALRATVDWFAEHLRVPALN
jgi:dipeptidyl aminopeptidase/acylaminoacyl peptidase